jgi:YesN/AraC family two-component response regulator
VFKILGDNILGKTIASIITNITKEKNFLLFRTGNHWQIKQIIQNILCEAFDNKTINAEVIKAYLTILFSKLLESERYEIFIKEGVRNSSVSVIDLLAYLEDNYLDISLEQTAAKFQFSPAHLGRIVKKLTGKTFSAIVQEQKFKHAAILLQLSDQSIDDISREIGYNNLTFFYKKFQLRYGMTPNEYRNSFKQSKDPL